MNLSRRFPVSRSRDEVVDVLAREDVLVSLLPGRTEIVERNGDTVTTRTHYQVLGREGDATFHWHFRMDGSVAFDKVCDGRVWRELRGLVEVEDDADGSVVVIEMTGRTKSFVPEFTIKVPMEEQMADMAEALQAALAR
jgi:carbon monoxide dehydrogenase subunit G